jgi:ferredoxin-NADP reductase
VHYLVGDHASPEHRHLLTPEHLTELVPDIACRDVYVCGPPTMMRITERNARQAGVPARCIHVERFAL